MTKESKQEMAYWLVVWNKTSGEFYNAITNTESERSLEEISSEYETKYTDYKVIHIGEGEIPPKTYRSLPYVK